MFTRNAFRIIAVALILVMSIGIVGSAGAQDTTTYDAAAVLATGKLFEGTYTHEISGFAFSVNPAMPNGLSMSGNGVSSTFDIGSQVRLTGGSPAGTGIFAAAALDFRTYTVRDGNLVRTNENLNLMPKNTVFYGFYNGCLVAFRDGSDKPVGYEVVLADSFVLREKTCTFSNEVEAAHLQYIAAKRGVLPEEMEVSNYNAKALIETGSTFTGEFVIGEYTFTMPEDTDNVSSVIMNGGGFRNAERPLGDRVLDIGGAYASMFIATHHSLTTYGTEGAFGQTNLNLNNGNILDAKYTLYESLGDGNMIVFEDGVAWPHVYQIQAGPSTFTLVLVEYDMEAETAHALDIIYLQWLAAKQRVTPPMMVPAQ